MPTSSLPVAIVGAGPVGLAAAVHVLQRGLTPLVFEAGDTAGDAIRRWSHVRMFSPWRYNVDPRAAELLAARGWQAPDPEHLPTGGELVREYLELLAALPELAPHLRFGARVTAITRARHDRMKDAGRADAPFLVRYVEDGVEREVATSAVIDASGTFHAPNPAGAAGIPALGESALGERIAYGLPDLLGADRERYAGRRLLVVGSGHSAFNALHGATRLREQAPGTEIHWAVRRPTLARVFGGGENDQLEERGRLGERVARLVDDGALAVHLGVMIDRFTRDANGGIVAWDGERSLPAVDEVLVATGFRPDLSILAELRLALDPGTESPLALAPLIDPNLHSCGTVRPHGAVELAHPEKGFYLAGMKSYGRAPTFLLRTGYEQVRSIAAALAGDWEAAKRVELELPATGVCSSQRSGDDDFGVAAGGCCGGPPPLVAISRPAVAAPVPVVATPAATACACGGTCGDDCACGGGCGDDCACRAGKETAA